MRPVSPRYQTLISGPPRELKYDQCKHPQRNMDNVTSRKICVLFYLKSEYYLSILSIYNLCAPRRTRYSFFKYVDASLDVVLGHVLNSFYEGLYVPARITNGISDNNYIHSGHITRSHNQTASSTVYNPII